MPTVQANGLELYYDTFGSPDAEPMLLIMGVGAQAVMWPTEFCEALVNAGYYVIRFDNRDVGLSQRLDEATVPNVVTATLRKLAGLNVNAPYTLSDMAADAAGVIEGLGLESAHVFGVSLGGMVAQTMAIECPHRVRTMTSMMSTPGSSRYFGKPKALLALLGRPVSKTPEEAANNSVAFFNAMRGARYAVDEEILRPAAALAFQRGVYPAGFARQMVAAVASGDRTRALKQVKLPTLIMHGSDDPLIPVAAGKATARAIPGAKLHIIEGLGHHLPRGVWAIIVEELGALTAQRSGA